jgi:hypothetical protein
MLGYLVSNKKEGLCLQPLLLGSTLKYPLVSFCPGINAVPIGGQRVILLQGFTNISLVIGFYTKKTNVKKKNFDKKILLF